MTKGRIRFGLVERQLASGEVETLDLQPGVNVIVGEPNTGKTMWLRMLDFLLGSPDKPADALSDEVAEKYDSIGAEVFLGNGPYRFERRWKEKGRQGTVFIDEQPMAAAEAQAFILEKLSVPPLNYPHGNPHSTRTWPALTFRELLRHIYRRQDCWTDLADKQADSTQHAALMQFLGLAEHIFTKEFGELVSAQQEHARLAARADQFQETLNNVARELLPPSEAMVAVTPDAVRTAMEAVDVQLKDLAASREAAIREVLSGGAGGELTQEIERLSERRAELQSQREELAIQVKRNSRRHSELEAYGKELAAEQRKLARAATADRLMAGLRVTHCPVCDQTVRGKSEEPGTCVLCAQPMATPNLETARARLKFERAQVGSEVKEATQLEAAARKLTDESRRTLREVEAELANIEATLAPARRKLAGLVQSAPDTISIEIGRAQSRMEQLERVKAAHDQNVQLANDIAALDKRKKELDTLVRKESETLDFEGAEEILANGFNDYLTAIERERPETWKQKEIGVALSRGSSSIRVGPRRWKRALGGTNTLYFLMAYQYSLLRLAREQDCHFPGLVIVDFPPTLEGVAVRDKENFIVKPFVALAKEQDAAVQVIFTGASFHGLEGPNRIEFSEPYV